MVWAISMPTSFGQFGPEGRLEPELEYETAEKFTKNRGLLNPEEFPKNFKLAKRQKILADLISTEARLLAVSAALRELIEGLEPGKHQFWPLTISMPRDVGYPDPYFGLIIHRHLETFLPEQSDPDAFDPAYSQLHRDHRINGPRISLSKTAIGDAHLWREKTLMGPDIYMSDKMYSETVRLNLNIPKPYEIKEM